MTGRAEEVTVRPTTPTGPAGQPAPTRALTGPASVPEPRSGTPSPTGLIGPAWIMREVTHVPGVLRLAGDRLTFVSTRATLFDRPLADLEGLAFRWHGFSGAFRVTVDGERLRVHVVRPAGAVSPDPALLAGLLSAADLPATDGEAEAGPRWREALTPARRRRS